MKYRLVFILTFIVGLTSFVTLQGQERRTLIIFAASSLTDAFEEIGSAFEAANPGVEVLFNFGGSSTLAAQLTDGAPGDVFASANTRQMQVVRQSGRIAGEPRTFARNQLVLIAPDDNPAGITSLRDLSNPGVKLVVAAPDVPVRTYTDLMLARLESLPTYGDTFRRAVMDNIVSEEDNVRQVFLKVALGEADAGIVYQSDITLSATDQVLPIPIPRAVNAFASYPIAVLNDSDHPEIAQSFTEYVLSSAGQDTLTRWGFIRTD
jgi:molybdate transport system substrate-binding protein